jgi:hypothetical protein
VPWTRLERAAVLAAGLVLGVVLIAVLSGYFAGHDPSGVTGAASVGQSFPDQGDGVLAPGQPHPRYDSTPPTSGPHVPVLLARAPQRLGVDQLLTVLAAGDVVVEYGGMRPPLGLQRLVARLVGPLTPALAADGDAVLIARRPGTEGLLALAWTRMAQVSGPDDPLLQQFIETWLGRGARRGGAPM